VRHQGHGVDLGVEGEARPGVVGAGGEADPASVLVLTEMDAGEPPVRAFAPLRHLAADGGESIHSLFLSLDATLCPVGGGEVRSCARSADGRCDLAPGQGIWRRATAATTFW